MSLEYPQDICTDRQKIKHFRILLEQNCMVILRHSGVKFQVLSVARLSNSHVTSFYQEQSISSGGLSWSLRYYLSSPTKKHTVSLVYIQVYESTCMLVLVNLNMCFVPLVFQHTSPRASIVSNKSRWTITTWMLHSPVWFSLFVHTFHQWINK